jgi:hypothetical protein
MLSRRCLIFVNGQVIFRCNNVCWREDVHLEDDDIESSFDMTFKHSIKCGLVTEDLHGDYTGALWEYSHRELGYESDVLNAFGGVLNVLLQRLRNGRSPTFSHMYGLPSFIFDWAVLWERADREPLRRRSGGWPSWSWCGWVGGIAMIKTGFDTTAKLETWLQHNTWIQWTIFDVEGRQRMRIPSARTYQRNEIQYPQNKPPPAVPIESDSPWLGNEIILRISKTLTVPNDMEVSPLTHLSTLSTTLYLAPSDVHIHGMSSYLILDSAGIECGTIGMDSAVHMDTSKPHEFLIVAKSEPGYHVMLVNRIYHGEICERVAIGSIRSEKIEQRSSLDQESVSVEWKEIWLL